MVGSIIDGDTSLCSSPAYTALYCTLLYYTILYYSILYYTVLKLHKAPYPAKKIPLFLLKKKIKNTMNLQDFMTKLEV